MPGYTAPLGAPIWFDLMSSDPSGAADFYCTLFGWEAEEPREEFGGYRNFTRNGHRVAGLSPAMETDSPSDIWSVYLHTADAEATAAAAESAGATIIVPPMAVGDEGTMLVVADPAGAAIGFWEPNNHPGYREHGEHGTPYWFECMSKDYAASTEFYPKVVDVQLIEVGTGGDPDAVGPDHYSQLMFGEQGYAGIMDAVKLFPAEVPSFWQVYITVDDVAAGVAQAAGLGAEVIMPGEVTPYGTLASLKDPFGAVFCLGQPPAGM